MQNNELKRCTVIAIYVQIGMQNNELKRYTVIVIYVQIGMQNNELKRCTMIVIYVQIGMQNNELKQCTVIVLALNLQFQLKGKWVWLYCMLKLMSPPPMKRSAKNKRRAAFTAKLSLSLHDWLYTKKQLKKYLDHK